MKTIKKIALGLVFLIGSCTCVACEEFRIPSFEERCITTEDGFTYYLDGEIGLCVVGIPETEYVTIPEYIDGKKVVQFGYKAIGLGYMEEHYADFSKCKTLVVNSNIIGVYVYGSYEIEKLIFNNYPYSEVLSMESSLIIPNWIKGTRTAPNTIVELRMTQKRELIEILTVDTIIIPEYVTVIEEGVFDGLEGVRIQTSYISKPDGWEEGWNGTCMVEWGVYIEEQ